MIVTRDPKMAVSIPTLVLVLLIPTLITAQVIPNEAWDYEQVREGAHMFWWLYGANSSKRDDLPLVMWLQVCAYVCLRPGGASASFLIENVYNCILSVFALFSISVLFAKAQIMDTTLIFCFEYQYMFYRP